MMTRVAVLAGGRSSEHEISLASGGSVAGGLREAGFEVTEVHIDRSGAWKTDGAPVHLEPANGLLGVDAVFPVLHGPFGEDGTVQGALELLGVPYIGSGVLASALCMDKLSLKRLLAHHRIDQVDFVAVGESGWRQKVEGLDLPVWVKPSRLGSSVGISPVHDLGELDAAIASAREHDPRVIVEAGARGKEVECSVLGNAETPDEEAALQVSPPGEIRIASEWYDFEAKYSAGGMDLSVPADISAESAGKLRATAADAFRLAGCSGLARCDFFVEPDGRVLLSEINTMPGFTPTSVYARLLEADGITYPELCSRLVDLAFDRHRRQAAHTF